jgi:5-methylthioadenosine/S-adenosylhomocysteine deaminase
LEEQAMKRVDVLLTNGMVVTMNALGELISQGAVAVADGELVAVGPMDEILAEFEAAEVVDCSGAAILPGLINTHTHVPMSLLRGLADDLRLDVWLFGYMLPVEREFVSPEFCRWGTLLSCAEMIRSGVTCFADMYYYEQEVAGAAAEAGMRAVCAETIMKWPTPDAESYDEGLAHCRAFVKEWKGHPLVTPAVGPHAPETSTPEMLREVTELALEFDDPYCRDDGLGGRKSYPVRQGAGRGAGRIRGAGGQGVGRPLCAYHATGAGDHGRQRGGCGP